MSGLAALLAEHNPPDLYQWHSAAHVPDIEHAVDHAGWRFVYVDGWTIEDEQSFLKAFSAAFALPDGSPSVDALGDRLGEVGCGDKQGVVVLWDGWSPFARHQQDAFARSLEVLRRRSGSRDGCAFAVLLRGEGPPLELPELPARA
ncbi:MAG TPA: barstar family protein [Nocardioidaceae bacterium]|nr:barstar family protein [Nocardioidaceae bacterium]